MCFYTQESHTLSIVNVEGSKKGRGSGIIMDEIYHNVLYRKPCGYIVNVIQEEVHSCQEKNCIISGLISYGFLFNNNNKLNEVL